MTETPNDRYPTYEETLAELASDLQIDADQLREEFTTWVNFTGGPLHPSLSPEQNARCYALYRVVKLKSACRMTAASRERWRDAAIAAGIHTVGGAVASE